MIGEQSTAEADEQQDDKRTEERGTTMPMTSNEE